MKVRPSVKPMCEKCKVIRRKGDVYKRQHETVDVPASNMKKSIAQILLDEGYIKSFQVVDDGLQGMIHILSLIHI